MSLSVFDLELFSTQLAFLAWISSTSQGFSIDLAAPALTVGFWRVVFTAVLFLLVQASWLTIWGQHAIPVQFSDHTFSEANGF